MAPFPESVVPAARFLGRWYGRVLMLMSVSAMVAAGLSAPLLIGAHAEGATLELPDEAAAQLGMKQCDPIFLLLVSAGIFSASFVTFLSARALRRRCTNCT